MHACLLPGEPPEQDRNHTKTLGQRQETAAEEVGSKRLKRPEGLRKQSGKALLQKLLTQTVFPCRPVCYNRGLYLGSSRLMGGSPLKQENMRP